MSDDSHGDIVKSTTTTYPQSAGFTLPASFYIGGPTAAETFSGHLRNIKIFSTYRSIGQSRQTLHSTMASLYGLQYSNIASYYPFDEPMGNKIREQISG